MFVFAREHLELNQILSFSTGNSYEIGGKIMLVRWTPFTEMDRLSQAMTRLFDSPESEYTGARAANVSWTPAIDVTEDKEKIVLVADLPGLAEKDIDVQIEKDVLTLKGNRTLERKADGELHRRYERASGSFVRSFTLPPTIDTEQVVASLKDGVLTLQLPKKPEAQPKKISVKLS
jgi:HSP20 family protein